MTLTLTSPDNGKTEILKLADGDVPNWAKALPLPEPSAPVVKSAVF